MCTESKYFRPLLVSHNNKVEMRLVHKFINIIICYSLEFFFSVLDLDRFHFARLLILDSDLFARLLTVSVTRRSHAHCKSSLKIPSASLKDLSGKRGVKLKF